MKASVLDGEGGDLTTDATYIVAPAALAAANVCLGAMLAHAFFFVEQSLEEDPVTHFVVLPNLQEDEGMLRENLGKSFPLSLRQRNT